MASLTVLSSASATAEAIRRRRLSAAEAVELALGRIHELNPALNAFLAVFDEAARAAARRADAALKRRGTIGPLHGVPVSVKDLILTTEGPTTAGSRIFGSGLVARRDALLVRRLRRAGAIVVGKTNLHEIALGVTTVNEHFGPARNPWNPSRMTGGSSGGSAAAVAAWLTPLSVGTDTRGSIRIPAACCGVTGFKPTRGLVPLDGVVPLSRSLDHAGPMAASAADCALMLAAMTRGAAASRLFAVARKARPVRGVRLGVSEYHLRDLDAAVQRAVAEAMDELGRLGCRLVAIPAREIDGLEEAQGASVAVSASEAVAYHDAHLREHPEQYGPRVRERLELGYRWKAIDYVRAREALDRVTAGYARVFRRVEGLVGASLPVTAPPLEATALQDGGEERGIVEVFTRLNSPQNMAGIPALSLPCGFDRDGMPVGLQILVARGRDDLALALGAAFQRATDWHLRRPLTLSSTDDRTARRRG